MIGQVLIIVLLLLFASLRVLVYGSVTSGTSWTSMSTITSYGSKSTAVSLLPTRTYYLNYGQPLFPNFNLRYEQVELLFYQELALLAVDETQEELGDNNFFYKPVTTSCAWWSIAFGMIPATIGLDSNGNLCYLLGEGNFLSGLAEDTALRLYLWSENSETPFLQGWLISKRLVTEMNKHVSQIPVQIVEVADSETIDYYALVDVSNCR